MTAPDPSSPLDLIADYDAIRQRLALLDKVPCDDETSPTAEMRARLRGELAAAVPTLLAALAEAQRERDECGDELQRLTGALTNARAVASDRIADRDKICRDVMAERDAARADADRYRHLYDEKITEVNGARAEVERMRRDLFGWSSIVDLRAAYEEVLDRWQRAEPVVEAAKAWRDVHIRIGASVDYRTQTWNLAAAVDTYASREGTDAEQR
jgi:chromosome segregation ATPase